MGEPLPARPEKLRRASFSKRVERLVKGAVAGGLTPGAFELRMEGDVVRLLPCAPVERKDDARPNTMDALLKV